MNIKAKLFQIPVIIAVLSLAVACQKAEEKTTDYTQFVDPIIGSDYHGHVFVGANLPFGAVQLGPNNFYNGWDWASGYHYSDSIIKGFSHLNLSGTGCADLGDILLMPATGKLKVTSGTRENHKQGYASKFSHKNETVKPGYYSVLLDRYQVKAELTTSERVGFHQYTFPKAEKARIIIDLSESTSDHNKESHLIKIDDQTIGGYRFSSGWASDQRVFFVLRLSKPFKEIKLYRDLEKVSADTVKGKIVRGFVEFSTSANEKILAKVGISPVSIENALKNIQAEVPEWNFTAIKKQAKEKWNKELSKINISTENLNHKKTFYTALYHSMFAPSLFNDHNKDYRGTDKKVYRKADFDNYTVFSLWDTYRTAHPLYTIYQKDRVVDMVNSMLAIYQQQGKLPVWHLMGCETNTMVGYHAVPVIVDAYLKDIKGFDEKLAYEAVKASAMRDERGLDAIKEKGFIPAGMEVESVAKALEYAIDDWAIAQMAKKMNKTEDYEYFFKRSKYYQKYFDKQTNFMRGKMSATEWRTPFDPISSQHRVDDYCEGNAWQYTWLVPQDVEGLVKLFGNKEAFIAKLDSLFTVSSELGEGASADISGLIGQYAHGNEPSHHIIYMYAYVGQQWKTAEKARKITTELYTHKPDGLQGNEDCGQMSAWYVMSSLGFYPVNPANGKYVFGSPLFNEAVINTGNAKPFKLTAHNNSKENLYIQKVKLNGKEYTKPFITHKEIMNGGHLEIWMGNKPNKQFGSAEKDLPKSNVLAD